jgi:MFS family permease
MSWELRRSLAAFQHRNFRLFVVGQFISLIGFWMQTVGQSWLVYRLTHSAWYLGLIAFSQQIPILLVSFAAGGIVDRSNRRRLIMLTQSLALIQATVLTILTFTGIITIHQLFVLALFLGLVSAFDLPARQSFLIQMVGKEDLINAIAINSSMFNAARMIGPAIAGFAVAKYGEAVCFFLNAVSYGAVLISLFMMRIQEKELSERRQTLIKDLGDGFRYIRNTRPVKMLLLLVGCFGIAGFPFVILLPIFADTIFHRGASGLGWLTAATGIGALMGAVFLAGRGGIKGISKVISFSAFGFSAALGAFGLSTHFWLAFISLCVAGIFMMTTVASINTAIQSMIPDALRGRIMSLFTTMLIGTAPIGSLIAGAVARQFGAQATVIGMAIICLCAAFWFYRARPAIVAEARRIYQSAASIETT